MSFHSGLSKKKSYFRITPISAAETAAKAPPKLCLSPSACHHDVQQILYISLYLITLTQFDSLSDDERCDVPDKSDAPDGTFVGLHELLEAVPHSLITHTINNPPSSLLSSSSSFASP